VPGSKRSVRSPIVCKVKEDLSITERSEAIRTEALGLGFAACGFSRAGALKEDAARLNKWLEWGHHAGMSYMARYFEKRTDPTKLVEGAKSVISLLYPYYTDRVQASGAPVLSKYAYGKDYHHVLKKKMRLLLENIRKTFGPVSGRAFVDSAPVLDRAWAREAGLGWTGKNSCLISRKAGSFFFIGELVTDLELEYNRVPEADHCGSCSRCIEACPTGAILEDRTLDAARCISYQTIENRGSIPGELRGSLSGRLFGCDICQNVCPWNRKAMLHREPDFEPAAGLLEMTGEDWTYLSEEEYNRLFKDSTVTRAGYRKIRDTLSVLYPGT
jgi:epoxyqueuosine reductase